MPAHINFLIRESYNWFAHSSKRLQDYREMHVMLTSKIPQKLLQLSLTRWMSHYECVKRILDQWECLQKCFKKADHEEKCYTARQLHIIYQDRKNYVLFGIFRRNIERLQE